MLSNGVKQPASTATAATTPSGGVQSPSSAPTSPASSQSSPSSLNRSTRSESNGGSSASAGGLIVESMSREETKNLIIQSLVNFVDDYFNNNSRCVILCALTCLIYDEIINQRWNTKRLTEAIKRIFRDLEFRDVNKSNQFFIAFLFRFKFENN